MKRNSRFHPPKASGFSLIEVAISMAIVSFGLIGILGMVPMGLTNFRQAMNNTVESQIVQSIISEQQLTSFANLQNTNYYYDADGNTVDSASSSQFIYSASVTTTNSVNVPSLPVNLTGSAVKVNIAIVNKTQPTQTNTFSIIVANQNN